MLRVGPRPQPGDHVGALEGGEGLQQQVLGPVHARQLQDGVVGRRDIALGAALGRHLPQVLAVIEHLGVGHVVLGVHLALDLEEVLGEAQVRHQALGQLRQRPEEARVDGGVRLEDRVVGVGDVEVDVAVVGVDGHLHRVAEVVDAAGVDRLGEGEAPGGGVGVLNPHQAALVDDDIGIGVIQQVRGDALHPILDVAVDQGPALPGDRPGEQDVVVLIVHGEGKAGQRQADGDAALAGVAGVGVRLSLGVVELLLPGVDDGVGTGLLTVVDLRPIDLQLRYGGHGRYVLDPELGEAVGADPGGRADGDAVAVGVLDVLVDPGLLRQLGVVNLPGGDHHLAHLAADVVPVDVHLVKLVVGAQALQLLIGLAQHPPVPEPGVGDGRVVGGDVGRRQFMVRRVHLRLD